MVDTLFNKLCLIFQEQLDGLRGQTIKRYWWQGLQTNMLGSTNSLGMGTI